MNKLLLAGLAFTAITIAGPAAAQQCGNDSSGFSRWVQDFKQVAPSNGISPAVVERAFANVNYNRATISADRGQKSFKLSFEEFLKKRGATTIISQGKKMKSANASLFDRLERRYGVPAGPIIAIWGMETGFGRFLGNQHTLSAVATLAYDCRRSDYFTEQLYAALSLIERGSLSAGARGVRKVASAYGCGARMRWRPSWIWNVRCAWPSDGSGVTFGYDRALCPGVPTK